MRVLIDTNVLISAALKADGSPWLAYQKAASSVWASADTLDGRGGDSAAHCKSFVVISPCYAP